VPAPTKTPKAVKSLGLAFNAMGSPAYVVPRELLASQADRRVLANRAHLFDSQSGFERRQRPCGATPSLHVPAFSQEFVLPGDFRKTRASALIDLCSRSPVTYLEKSEMLSKVEILRKLSLRRWILAIIILLPECLVGAGRDTRARSSSRRVGYDRALDFVVIRGTWNQQCSISGDRYGGSRRHPVLQST
jgi:hypothetical protein